MPSTFLYRLRMWFLSLFFEHCWVGDKLCLFLCLSDWLPVCLSCQPILWYKLRKQEVGSWECSRSTKWGTGPGSFCLCVCMHTNVFVCMFLKTASLTFFFYLVMFVLTSLADTVCWVLFSSPLPHWHPELCGKTDGFVLVDFCNNSAT